MLFVIYTKDRPDGLSLRLETRPAHLEFLEASGDTLKLAGPLLGDDGKPIGSMLIVDCEDRAAAEQWAALDPYARAGLFAETDVQPWTWTVGGGLDPK